MYVNIGGDPSGGSIEAGQIGYVFTIENKNYVSINNLVIRNANYAGVSLKGTSSGIVVTNVESYSNGNEGFKQWDLSQVSYTNIIGSYNLDDGFSLHNTSTAIINGGVFNYNTSGIQNINSSQISINNVTSTNNSLFGFNVVYDANGVGGISTISNSVFENNNSNIEVDDDQQVTIENTIINGGAYGIYLSTSKVTTISNITISSSTSAAIYSNGIGLVTVDKAKIYGVQGHVIDIWIGSSLVLNNSILFNNLGLSKYSLVIRDGATATIKNCVLYNNSNGIFMYDLTYLYNTVLSNLGNAVRFVAPGIPGDLTLSNNNFYNNVTNFSGGIKENTNGITQDPKYISAATGDFSLQSDSPNIDRGTSIGGVSATDYIGKQRYDYPNVVNAGSGTYAYYDIGAYEYVTPPDPIITSPSHPSESSWYCRPLVVIELISTTSPTTHYHYLFNQNPSPTKTDVESGIQDDDGSFSTSINYDGIWYVHIVSQNLDNDPSQNFISYQIKNSCAGGHSAPVVSNISYTQYSPPKVILNNGSTSTNNREVTVSFDGQNIFSNISISEDPTFKDATSIPFSSSTTFTLSDIEGTKTVYVKFSNILPNFSVSNLTSNISSASIYYFSTQPTSTTTQETTTLTSTLRTLQIQLISLLQQLLAILLQTQRQI